MAVLLLLLCLSATTTWALNVTMVTLPEGSGTGGSYAMRGESTTQFTVTPNDGFYVKSVMWSKEGINAQTMEAIGSENEVFYQAPTADCDITITFMHYSNNVQVRFNTKGYGSPVPDMQNYTFGENPVYAVRPATDPTDESVVFVGWYKSLSDANPYDFSTPLDKTLPYDNTNDCYFLMLNAKWHVISGTCGVVDATHDGTEVTWSFSKSPGSEVYDVLTINGNGAMKNYSKTADRPWHDFGNDIKTIVIDDGVTSIGKKAFFDMMNVTSDIVIPASVTSIGANAFAHVAAHNPDGINITSAEGSQLETIGGSPFLYSHIHVDLTTSQITKITENVFSYKSNPFMPVATLPSSVSVIKKNAFCHFESDHVYIRVPSGKTLTVNGQENKDVTDGKADIINYLFESLQKRKKSKMVTLAMTDGLKYNITTDDFVNAYYNDGLEPIAEARADETVVLSYDGEKVPAGKYVSDFTVTKEGGGTVAVESNEDNTDFTFIMPRYNVTVTTQIADQVEYTLDLTTETQVIIPKTMYMLMQTMMGYFYSELNAEGTEFLHYIDINRDGVPDLQLMEPVEDDEDVDEDDDFADEYSVKRLPGADAVTSNSHFTFVYPQAYKYNKVLVNLNNSFTDAEQPVLEPLDDKYDNSSALAEWAGDGNKHNVIINQRTLYRDGYWNTLCLPFNVDDLDGTPLEGATVMELDVEDKWRLDNEEWIMDNVNGTSQTGLDGTTLYLYFKNASAIKAGVPYIIKWTAAAQNIFEPTFLGVTISSTTAGCVASKDKMVQFQGTYNPITWDTEDQSILFLGDTNTLYYPQPKLKDPSQPFDSDTNPMCYPFLGAFRAYFQINPEQGGGNVREFVLNFDEGETTGIESMHNSECIMHNKADAWFSLDGRKLNSQPTQKGLYIYKDRKVAIK